MCSGLPVVYTNCHPHAEYLNGASAGLAVDGILQPEAKSGNLRTIADVSQAIHAIRKVYLNRQLRGALGANGRSFAKEYCLGIQAAKWHRVFQAVGSAKEPLGSINSRCHGRPVGNVGHAKGFDNDRARLPKLQTSN
jgi:hypothetical protein